MVDPIHIPDEPRKELDSKDCVYPDVYEGHFSRLLIRRDEIIGRASKLAELISEDYVGKRPVLVCVLKGAAPFYSHMCEALQDMCQAFSTEFIRVSSYEGSETTGNVKICGGIDYDNIKGRDVILIEDIIDTGTTLSHLIPTLEREARPQSIEVCSLLTKRLDEKPKYQAKYVGFSIPPQFVIGYGLDYNEYYRDLKDIWIISEKGIKFGAA